MTFKFPPPPPPPPKATSSPNDAPEYASSQRGRGNNIRGDMGRGWAGRGRGNNKGVSRDGHGHRNGRTGSGTQSNNSFRGGHESSGRGRGGSHNQIATTGHPSLPQMSHEQTDDNSPRQTVPTGAYVNPLFANPLQYGAQMHALANQTVLAQAMAFMSTQAGMHSMNAFANHTANGVASQSTQPMPIRYSQQSPQQRHGNKRKWNERSAPKHVSQQYPQPKTKPQKAKAAPPPAVPSFGFALPLASPPGPSLGSALSASDLSPAQNKRTQKKRKINLGLTSRGREQSETASEVEDEALSDEEAALASSLATTDIVFEYQGQTMSLRTPAEMAAWIKDRKKNFPTQRRIAEKEKEAQTRRQRELEFLRKLKQRDEKDKSDANHVRPTNEKPSSEVRRKSKEERQKELDQLRKKLHESVLAKKSASAEPEKVKITVETRKLNAVDLGLGYSSDTDSDFDESSILSESSVVSSSEESTEESDSNSDDGDSDSAPEEQSSKTAPPAIFQPPPPPVSTPNLALKQQKKFSGRSVCKHWQATGKCSYGVRCRMAHPPREEPKRMSLWQVMVEKELQQKDELALKAIRWLGQNGHLDPK
ncbi:hypothetical protein CC78DRAFT_611394 [Lojkania enalia]|uniref:C3H1-type domain-containing protein n=1 Tax=Lojkania enalia TaxID=147567 RepID=A0A9P4NCG6_9PLEO|nr:hypothetical protein CC78DRAFT_611394 [Didymosphaeria enalia]